MTEFENEQIKHQIYLEQYKNGQANKIIAMLDTSNKRIAEYIRKTDGIYTKARYKEVAQRIKEVAKALKENVDESTDIDGIIDYELRKQKKLHKELADLIQGDSNIKVNMLYPSLEQIKTSALFKPVVDNMTYQSYLESIETGLYNVWDSHIRTGYLTGQTTQQIVREMLGSVAGNAKLADMGAIHTFRNSVYMNTRTVLQSFANETRERVFEQNEKYFGDDDGYKYEYLATLDSRTCIPCGLADSKRYKTLKEAPTIPQHRGCRCVVLPIPAIELDNDTRASKFGQVDSKLTFSDWLKEQTEDVQKDVLGATRFKMYQDGTPINSFVQNNKVLTLNELNAKIDNTIIFNNINNIDTSDIIKDLRTYDFISKDIKDVDREDFVSDLSMLDKNSLYTMKKYFSKLKCDFYFNGDTSHYNPNNNNVYIKGIAVQDERSTVLGFKKDTRVFLHETGHWLDYNALGDNKIIHNELSELRKKLRQDTINYTNSLHNNENTLKSIKDINENYEVYKKLYKECQNPLKNGVSDIFSGILKTNMPYYHKKKYWTGDALETETIAHFFEVRAVGGEKLKILKSYFPTAYEYFENYIGDIK